MTTLVSSIVNRVKQNKLVAESLNICQIAAEVYQTVRQQPAVSTVETGAEKPAKTVEQLYLDACTRVTKQSHEQAARRADYQAVAFSFRNLRAAREKSGEQLRKIGESSAGLRRQLQAKREGAQAALSARLSSARKCAANARETAAGYARVARVELAERAAAAGKYALNAYESLLASDLYTRASELLVQKAKFARDVIMFTLLTGRDLSYELLKWTQDKLAGYALFSTLGDALSRQFQNLKAGLGYVAQTFQSNRAAAMETFNFTYSSAANALDKNYKVAHLFFVENKKLTETFSLTYNYLASVLSKNYKVAHLFFVENKKLAETFLKNYEVEVFYSPKNSVRVIELVRVVGNMFTSPHAEDHVVATVETAKTA